MNRLPNKKHSQKVIFRDKSNKFLFACKAIHQIFWFAVGAIGGILLPTLFFSGIVGHIYNDGKLNQPILSLGLCLIPLVIICRIVYIIWLRSQQFYIITADSIYSKGGVFNKFNRQIRIADIRSLDCRSSLIQQLAGCGDIIICTAAIQGTIVLKNINNIQDICYKINDFR